MKTITKLAFALVLSIAGIGAAVSPMGRGSSPTEVKAEGEITTWDDLKGAIDALSDKSSTPTTLTLGADIVSSGSSGDRIKINKKTNLTIDLNGHNVNRNREDNAADGHAFEIQGDSSVTITNSAETASVITGGYADHGGAINIHDGSTLTLSNVVIDKNDAKIDGGAIYNRGTLNISNVTITDCYAGDTAGAIFNTDEGHFTIDNVTITNCRAQNDGGAFNIHLGANSSIANSKISNNYSFEEDGGAISLDASGKTLTITNTTISDNETSRYGGGIEVEDGTLVLSGSTVSNNTAVKGGGIYNEGSVNVASSSVIKKNYASEHGGGIYNDGGNVEVNASTLDQNKAVLSGGGIALANGGDATLASATLTANEAQKENGGGVAMLAKGSELTISGSTSMSDNFACNAGGAIYFAKKASKLFMSGSLAINGNIATIGSEVFLDEGKLISVTGDLAGSTIGVTKREGEAIFTSGFGDVAAHAEVAPSTFFFCNASYEVATDDSGEGKLVAKSASSTDPYLLSDFIPYGQQVVATRQKLTGSNWMSGISGERYLNEINIPGTHDTSMRSIGISAGAGSTGGYGDKYALTQRRYIPEQFEEGVRYVDIRLNNRYAKYRWYWSNKMIDDGENLWMCHGKKAGGTYFAEDVNGNLINLNMVLDYARDFLERNPSECLIMGFTDESYYAEEYNDLINARLHDILEDYIAKHPINTSTGDSLWYLENNDLMQDYTYMPQLKQVRGKILFEPDDIKTIGGFRDYKDLSNINHCGGQDTSYTVFWDKKLDSLHRFFYGVDSNGNDNYSSKGWTDRPKDYYLPSDGGEWKHKGDFFKIGLNCAPMGKLLPDETPFYHADHLFPYLFDESYKYDGTEYPALWEDISEGRYIGWVKTDAATGKEWGMIYRSNFFDNNKNYVTVTVNPNLDDDNYQIKTYSVYENTPITVPYFNYDYDQATNQNYFCGWKVGDKTYLPGQTVPATGDNMTFVALWANEDPSQATTAISVVFSDCNNADNIRPSSVDLIINDDTENPYTLNSSNGWTIDYTGLIASIVPNSEVIDENNLDEAGKYHWEVSGDMMHGYTVSFAHTGVATDTFSGTIHWDDNDDFDDLRPDSVTIEVYKSSDTNHENLVASTTASNDNGWLYSFDGLALYENAAALSYDFVIKNDGLWAGYSNYTFTQSGNDIIAYHDTATIYGSILWAESETPARPTSVTVNFMSGDTKVGATTVTSNDDWEFESPLNANVKSVTIEVEAVNGYQIEIKRDSTDDYAYFHIYMKQIAGETVYDLSDVDSVTEKIRDLSETVVYTPAYKESLNEARVAYEALSDENKALVYNLDKLVRLEAKFADDFAELIAIDNEILDAITVTADLGHAKWNAAVHDVSQKILALDEGDRNSLWHLSEFNSLITELGTCMNVCTLIEAISLAEEGDDRTAAVENAQAAYNALDDEQKLRIDNIADLYKYDDDYLSAANTFASDFLDATDTACAGEGDDHKDALDAIWSDLNTSWKALSDEAKAVLCNGTGSDTISAFYARYVHIVSHYGSSYAFEGGPVVQSSVNTGLASISSESGWVALIAIAASVAIVGSVIIAKRRNAR